MARIEFHRVLLHDACGVTPIDSQQIRVKHERCLKDQEQAFFCHLERDLFSDPELELTAVDVVSDCTIMDASVVFDGLLLGSLARTFIGRQSLGGACPHSQGISCLDVDRTGLTLLYVDESEAMTAFIPFASRVSTRSELVEAIEGLRPRS